MTGLRVTAALFAIAALVGCAALRLDDPARPATAQRQTQVKPITFRLAQVQPIRNAPFEICADAACPKVTPKTVPQAGVVASNDVITTPLAPPEKIQPLVLPLRQVALGGAPSGELLELKPPIVPRKITLGFATGSATLTSGSKRALQAALPDARRAAVIEIRGRTDGRGRSELNEALALSRALAVRDYLRQQELPESTVIRFSAKGSCCYIASNESPSGRAANRRVEVEFQPPLQMAKD